MMKGEKRFLIFGKKSPRSKKKNKEKTQKNKILPKSKTAWGLYASAPRLPPPAPAGRGSASAAAAAAGEAEMTMTAKTASSGQQQQLMAQQQRRAMPEPALFLLDADGQVVFADVSNSPFCRPDLALVIEGIRFVLETGYPTRGTLFFEE